MRAQNAFSILVQPSPTYNPRNFEDVNIRKTKRLEALIEIIQKDSSEKAQRLRLYFHLQDESSGRTSPPASPRVFPHEASPGPARIPSWL